MRQATRSGAKRITAVLALALAACGSTTPTPGDDPVAPPKTDRHDSGAPSVYAADATAPVTPTEDAGPGPGSDAATPIPVVDDDHDGLDDAHELAWAKEYMPFVSLSPSESCGTSGFAVRVSPHPDNPKQLHIHYDFLYDDDCGTAIGGIGAHSGDAESFALTVDPEQAAPAGILVIKAVSHRGTLCERVSICGQCPGQTACATLEKGGAPWPAVWASKSKHGSYVNRGDSCSGFATCGDVCEDSAMPVDRPIVNVGEPDHPLVHDLTDQGFVTQANGWKHAELFHYDPWSTTGTFGGGGNVAHDFVDTAFATPACK